MDSPEFIARQIRALRIQADATMQGMTDELFNWQPPGLTNAINAIFLHLNSSEDHYIQRIIQGQSRVWERDNWEDMIGANAPGRGKGWSEIQGATFSLDSVLPYQAAVRSATDAYISSLTPEELSRKVAFIGGERPVADVLGAFVIHTAGHAGEIAALKGIQGVKGLGF